VVSLGEDGAPRHPPLLSALAAERLMWFPEAGCGYFPVAPSSDVYDAAYFSKYEAYAETPMGKALNVARLSLVARHYAGHLVDVGIGAGSFVAARGANTDGYDINPVAVEWLNRRDKWWNPRTRPCDAVSMWDALEHIPDFAALLDHVRAFVFVSVPIFEGPDHVLASKHYRRDEHCWYFTTPGFVDMMWCLGWQCVEVNEEEIKLGRDSIASFAFRRYEDRS
jgi:Methyltransferase domain